MYFNKVNQEYYKILNVPITATIPEIKKSYYKLALTHHPDKGGDADQFKKITEAFEVLSNENKKKIDDSGGLLGKNNKFINIFNNKKINKGKDIDYDLNLTLEEIYKGLTKTIQIKKKNYRRKYYNKL